MQGLPLATRSAMDAQAALDLRHEGHTSLFASTLRMHVSLIHSRAGQRPQERSREATHHRLQLVFGMLPARTGGVGVRQGGLCRAARQLCASRREGKQDAL